MTGGVVGVTVSEDLVLLRQEERRGFGIDEVTFVFEQVHARRNPSSGSTREQRCVVFDAREWLVEVMQQLLPTLVRRRASEAYSVTLEIFPPNEKKVSTGGFQTALQLVSSIPGHGRYDGLRLCERRFEIVGSIGNDIEDSYFEHHGIASYVRGSSGAATG